MHLIVIYSASYSYCYSQAMYMRKIFPIGLYYKQWWCLLPSRMIVQMA